MSLSVCHCLSCFIAAPCMRLSWSSGEAMQERELMRFTDCRPTRGTDQEPQRWTSPTAVWTSSHRGGRVPPRYEPGATEVDESHRGTDQEPQRWTSPTTSANNGTIRDRRNTLSRTFLEAPDERPKHHELRLGHYIS